MADCNFLLNKKLKKRYKNLTSTENGSHHLWLLHQGGMAMCTAVLHTCTVHYVDSTACCIFSKGMSTLKIRLSIPSLQHGQTIASYMQSSWCISVMFGKEADKEKRSGGDPTMHGDWCCTDLILILYMNMDVTVCCGIKRK